MLPYGRQCIEDDDIAAVVDVLRSDFLTTGPLAEAFEAELARRTQAPHAVVCSSGTAGLHLAAMALGLGRGDRVVVPSMTFMATATAPHMTGAEVVFADVDPDTGLMTEETFGRALARAGDDRVKAVFPVHLNGQTADIPSIVRRARALGAAVVEDAAHAIGTRQPDAGGERAPVGACGLSDMAVFSFHPVKTVTQGEGGAVTTRDAALATRLRRLRSHGIVREPDAMLDRDAAFDSGGRLNPWYHEMHEPGLNYRASDIHCALGLSQLRKLDRFVARRGHLAALYDTRLAALAPMIRPVPRVRDCDPAWHLYAVLIDFDAIGIERAAVMTRLREQGVGTQVHYIPVHRQPYYRKRYGDLDLPGADAYYRRQLSLPLYPSMRDSDVDRVVDALAAIVRRT